ncbi:hypothetical protein RND81_06G250800 [Saponaria officinalis]|uniref:Cellulose synthase-like protein G3 n=1 Tax=Saponaria officinalis TaxID=3572 RepID=A0AAW1KG65_SAPOF
MAMENTMKTTITSPLHTQKLLRRATFNRLYMAVYAVAIIALIYRHLTHTLFSNTLIITIPLLLADLTLAFRWATTQSFHFRPVRFEEFPEKLENFAKETGVELPRVDIFICTADPYKEPPIVTVNTALAVMAYEYPTEKISVYVSDDGGSQVTMFALMEAANFARHWVPFCRDNHVLLRSPEVYFTSNSCNPSLPQVLNLKKLYEDMKFRVEKALESGKVEVDDDNMRQMFSKWTDDFTRQTHPSVIQVLLSSVKDKDVSGVLTPNLIYVSREKSKLHHHHFKAGALNTLVRVSASMTNAPIMLTLDCDTYSNDPQTVKRALCYFLDPTIRPMLGYIQFPQQFRGLNKGDIYFSEQKRLFQFQPLGMNGLQGPNYVGTGCFFQRRTFFGPPSSIIHPELIELRHDHLVKGPIGSPEVLQLAYLVAACDYENQTQWGAKIGFRYGSLVEDYNTGYKMQCEGWRSIFCHPKRAAFLGDSPITLIDILVQCKRWMIGLLDVLFSKYSPLTLGVRRLGLLMGLAYTHLAFWSVLAVPITVYAFVPQIALINGISIFPKASEAWFYLYIFMYVAAYGKDLLDFMLEGSTVERWWNSQRMWMVCGVSSYLFACVEYCLSSLGIAVHGFSLTSKIQDDEQSKKYDQGKFEFGVASPLFLPITVSALLNLVSFVTGLWQVYSGGIDSMEGLILQIMLSGIVVLSGWPMYHAMLFRTDSGRMPPKISFIAAFLVSILCVLPAAFLKISDLLH